jgi:hypothetical protein
MPAVRSGLLSSRDPELESFRLPFPFPFLRRSGREPSLCRGKRNHWRWRWQCYGTKLALAQDEARLEDKLGERVLLSASVLIDSLSSSGAMNPGLGAESTRLGSARLLLCWVFSEVLFDALGESLYPVSVHLSLLM